jgi:hypothetical protein
VDDTAARQLRGLLRCHPLHALRLSPSSGPGLRQFRTADDASPPAGTLVTMPAEGGARIGRPPSELDKGL